MLEMTFNRAVTWQDMSDGRVTSISRERSKFFSNAWRYGINSETNVGDGREPSTSVGSFSIDLYLFYVGTPDGESVHQYPEQESGDGTN